MSCRVCVYISVAPGVEEGGGEGGRGYKQMAAQVTHAREPRKRLGRLPTLHLHNRLVGQPVYYRHSRTCPMSTLSGFCPPKLATDIYPQRKVSLILT